ncbi:hypothetical protein I7I50_10738 [Histoplasma capsulatum G186AR]|uniref:Uncharacterized protein n=1 Tax=Ajellomyces capsulatus TaxID=5037 RepID=A0A8H7Z6T8_AJECA|nr:hypothetical protein I7I52_01977 [Histoplasma capsulatum]QSS69444.1 hypothetical protein I7I50_10738 [Histoplasma capsulatum G186AR]
MALLSDCRTSPSHPAARFGRNLLLFYPRMLTKRFSEPVRSGLGEGIIHVDMRSSYSIYRHKCVFKFRFKQPGKPPRR